MAAPALAPIPKPAQSTQGGPLGYSAIKPITQQKCSRLHASWFLDEERSAHQP